MSLTEDAENPDKTESTEEVVVKGELKQYISSFLCRNVVEFIRYEISVVDPPEKKRKFLSKTGICSISFICFIRFFALVFLSQSFANSSVCKSS